MAPPKTMVISQQQQQPITQQGESKQAKPRKRKPKQQQQQQPSQQQSARVEQQEEDSNIGVDSSKKLNKAEPATITVVPSERTTLKKQPQQRQQVSSLLTKGVAESKCAALPIISPATVIAKHQQLASEEADDIDAGIELDGSSNSGSSVKDMSEDQVKSASVSPVMAQSNLVNENCSSVAKHAVEVEPIEQLSKSLCSSPGPIKKTTKQQLAANQQVIDADEQQLQQKLQSKQKQKLVTPTQEAKANAPTKDQQQASGKNTQVTQASDDKSARVRRRFSSQSSLEGQDASLCKVCEQHVYQMERMLAEKAIYHKQCFRCHQCKIQLRIDNYSSHEGQLYCKAHHRQIFQPQVKLDNDDDVDIVAKSTSQELDDYLLHRGRLSELSFSFLQPKPEGIQKRQMIICENEPAELPKDVVRCDTKLDDGIEQLNLNLNNILEKFERGNASNGEESLPSSAGVVIEKPSINIKKTLMAFESRSTLNPDHGDEDSSELKRPERPVVKKLTNLNGFLNRQNINESEIKQQAPVKPLAVRRSESLMMRLKKYESRIAGEQVDEDGSDDDAGATSDLSQSDCEDGVSPSGHRRSSKGSRVQKPKKISSINLSSLKNQWENGDISRRRNVDDDEREAGSSAGDNNNNNNSSNSCNGNSPLAEKNEELCRIKQQVARKKSGESSSVKNIYENAIREAQLQQQASRRDSGDLSALNGFSTNDIQQQLLQNSLNGGNAGSNSSQNMKTPTTPNKDHFQLNFSNKANKLKEKFELGLINNSSHDDSDLSDGDESPALTKLEQIRQEKMEDLSVFTDGEIKAREARSLFQQIDRRISAASGANRQPVVNSRSLASIGASMRTKLTNQMNSNLSNNNNNVNGVGTATSQQQQIEKPQPIRLTNNVVRT